MQGTSIGPNVLFGTRDVACIIYRARGERVYVHLSSIESSIDGLRITGPNVDTLLADYRAAWKQFSTATLPLSLPFYPFPFCPPAFSRRPALPAFQFFSLFFFFFFFFFFGPSSPLFSSVSFCLSVGSPRSARGAIRALARSVSASIQTRALAPRRGKR